jgi:hypothetical protein
MVRVATAWPMAERLSGGHASLAGVNVVPIAGRQQAEVEQVRLYTRRGKRVANSVLGDLRASQ